MNQPLESPNTARTATLPPLAVGATHHHLGTSPETAHWGFFDAALKPVLHIRSGDRVTIDCVSGNPEDLPPAGSGFELLLLQISKSASASVPASRHAVARGFRQEVRLRPACSSRRRSTG